MIVFLSGFAVTSLLQDANASAPLPVTAREEFTLIVGAADGSKVALCPDGGTYELWGDPYLADDGRARERHDAGGEDSPQASKSADAVVDAFVANIQMAASPANPSLEALDEAELVQQLAWFDEYYGPARGLILEPFAESADGSAISYVMRVETEVPAPDGTDSWSQVLLNVGEGPGGYYLTSAVICTDAIVTREGQLAIARARVASGDESFMVENEQLRIVELER